MAIIAPSLLSADFMNLERDSQMLNESVADWFHLDVMDGRFVPNITFGMPVVKAFSKVTHKPLDVHLMIVEPEKYIQGFAEAGAHVISVHIEATNHLHRAMQMIRQLGVKSGIAVNPHTTIQSLEDVISEADVVCLMSVNPGFGGQKFIPQTIEKIQRLKELILKKNLSTLIEIDGGVTLENASEIIHAGADVLVAGNTVFGSSDPTEMIEKLKSIA